MRMNVSKLPWPAVRFAIGIAIVIAAWTTHQAWWPPLSSWVDATLVARRSAPVKPEHGHEDHSDGPHAGHDHAAYDTGQPESTSIQLTPQAMRNLGLTAEQ